jgi:hypothetical protein
VVFCRTVGIEADFSLFEKKKKTFWS